jgi:predicted metalloprotease with PDZ domain
LKSILKAESDFTKGLPVDRYVFLFYFGPFSAGAWEHSYSSEYVMKDDTLTDAYAGELVSIVAHEFFHVNTPLNLHSELIEHFNFEKPVMSQHLWLYEGTTEWAAQILQLRDSLITLDQYLQAVQSKMRAADNYNPSLSLTELGVHSTEMQDQYPNIYQKGALVSGLLDIRLLQLSHGTKGLREVLLQLSKEYGKKRAFSEEKFFDVLVASTYPEIRDFVDRYIRGTDKLPTREYFRSLGIEYRERGDADSSRGTLGVGLRPADNAIVVSVVDERSRSGLEVGDVIKKVDGTPLTFANAQQLFGKVFSMKPGEGLTIAVERRGRELEIGAVMVPRITRHIFAIDPHATAEQVRLRSIWMKNL